MYTLDSLPHKHTDTNARTQSGNEENPVWVENATSLSAGWKETVLSFFTFLQTKLNSIRYIHANVRSFSLFTFPSYLSFLRCPLTFNHLHSIRMNLVLKLSAFQRVSGNGNWDYDAMTTKCDIKSHFISADSQQIMLWLSSSLCMPCSGVCLEIIAAPRPPALAASAQANHRHNQFNNDVHMYIQLHWFSH